MSTSPVPSNTCGTKATGWMDASHPTEINQQKVVVFRFHWNNNVSWKDSVGRVTLCAGGYFVYYLPNTPHCDYRYCGALMDRNLKIFDITDLSLSL